MNRSYSPILRPLSNISNRKLTSINVQNKQNQNSSKSFAQNSVIYPQQTALAKSTIYEVKTLKNNIITPKSSITSFTSTPRLSLNSDDDNKSKELRKTFNSQQNSKFLLFKIIVFLSVIAFALLLYQIQANLSLSSKSNTCVSVEVQYAKEKIIADSISNSIISAVVYDRQKINLQKEKDDVKSFYQDEFSSNLWKMVVENVNKDLRIRLEKQDKEEFWTV
ncbi:unnamed protein product (macronuclear) [Paramecium tetraurelia]|uniref:Uncharacterized protein n=1 Tax=Paramecium tetraurelia TaxID=5888 RepID=A0BEC8_PARTE|nr:uncharacterized protein GSPATT00027928001 [Paramecium tetraurelia]CAK56895.1 unnamed protein product [Paramecium tetraurelia]|eukprot:XP_001424293.1 hypothetical protein (macronuclear) [Paramecium tetraurelia strain d4-2]